VCVFAPAACSSDKYGLLCALYKCTACWEVAVAARWSFDTTSSSS
jgi:hypothetical protein